MPKLVPAAATGLPTRLPHRMTIEALDAACDRVRDSELLQFAGNPSPGSEAADTEEAEAGAAWAALRDEIADTPATTLEGLRVKATFCSQPWVDADLMLSIVADILDMTGGDA